MFGTFARDSSLGSVSRNVVVTKKQCRLGDEVRKRCTDLFDGVAAPFDAYASFVLCSILRIGGAVPHTFVLLRFDSDGTPCNHQLYVLDYTYRHP